MSVTLSPELAKSNPYLKIQYFSAFNFIDQSCEILSLDKTTDEDLSFCRYVEKISLTGNYNTEEWRVTEITPTPPPCAECPVFRNNNTSTQSQA
jgi:hypothetical protein